MIKLNTSNELQERLQEIKLFIQELINFQEKHEMYESVDMDYCIEFYFDKEANKMSIQPCYISLSTSHKTLPNDIIQFLEKITPITVEYSINHEIDGDPLDLDELLYHKVTPNKQNEFTNILSENDVPDDFIIEYNPPWYTGGNPKFFTRYLGAGYIDKKPIIEEIHEYFKHQLN